jgi:hypothetical protein
MEKKKFLLSKIEGIHRGLMGCYQDTMNYAPSIVGSEREIFQKELLSKILPINYRIGSGSIVDSFGSETGQIDAVIELPFSLSFPISSFENRLYLADTVGAAFEIKSNLYNQWNDAIDKVIEIKKLNRYKIKENEFAMLYDLKIPSFVVSYTGYSKLDTIYSKLASVAIRDRPDGIWIIEQGVFYGMYKNIVYESHTTSGSIMAFISCLYQTLKDYSDKDVKFDEYAN